MNFQTKAKEQLPKKKEQDTGSVTADKPVDPEWPTLDAVKVEEIHINGVQNSRQHSPSGEHKVSA